MNSEKATAGSSGLVHLDKPARSGTGECTLLRGGMRHLQEQ